MYHTHSLGINTLRTRPLSSRSFHSSSEIKTNRQGTMNTGWNARNETTAPQDHHRECSLGAEGSEPTPTGITLLPQLLCTGPWHGSDLNKGPHGCTQRHRFMHSCGVGGSSWCWRHMNQWLVLGGSYLLAIPASLNSDEASRCVFQEYIYTHTLLHADNMKILCRPEMLPKLPSLLNILYLYFHNSQLLIEGEDQKPEYSLPGPSPEALESSFLTWICISKLGKRLQNQICKVSPEILRIAKAWWWGFLTGDGLERNGI